MIRSHESKDQINEIRLCNIANRIGVNRFGRSVGSKLETTRVAKYAVSPIDPCVCRDVSPRSTELFILPEDVRTNVDSVK